ncbi:MAG TPA: class I SAM-dependent methyltransferase [Elusimicrobiales bacterium]|nr:class I SAM-dependent methyltransferase [Elusimicrobiales bacterium]
MKVPAEWYKAFFKNSFYNPASPAAVAKAPSEAAFVLRQLKLKKGSALLDLCCGPGRHAVEFARKGLAVTGFDFSREYLEEALERAQEKRIPLRLVRGDMRRLKFSGEFDAAVNLFTSFGYFRKFSDDIKTLKGVARALKPGGLFLIDIINGDYVRKHFIPNPWHDLGDHYHLEETALNKDGAFNSWIKIHKMSGKIQKKTFFSRLYDRARLAAALKTAGLEPLKFWGNFAGQTLSPDSIRLIALAAKPGRRA